MLARAAHAILAPIIDVFAGLAAELYRALQQWADAIRICLQPMFAALAALNEDRCTVDRAHDATQCNGYHLDQSDV